MLTSEGNQFLQIRCRDLRAELLAHGGPWAAPLASHGMHPEGTEITDPASGMLRQKVLVDERGFFHATWVATTADDRLVLHGIGFAATETGPFLIRTASRPVLRTGDQVSLHTPMDIILD